MRTLTIALLNVKSIDQVRQRYLDKLFEVGLLRSQPTKKHQSSKSVLTPSNYLRLGRYAIVHELYRRLPSQRAARGCQASHAGT